MSNNGKKKILWVSDAVATTGFARVSHSVIENLPEKYEVHHIGINYLGDPHDYEHKIYPAMLGGDLYGKNRLKELIESVKPDLIFFLNDVWTLNLYLEELKSIDQKSIPVVVYFPIDSTGFEKSWFEHYDLVYDTCVYTQFGKDVILNSGGLKDDDTIHIVPHGVSEKDFYPFKDKEILTGKDIAKRTLFPVKERPEFLESFVILNANRNQPRKRVALLRRR